MVKQLITIIFISFLFVSCKSQTKDSSVSSNGDKSEIAKPAAEQTIQPNTITFDHPTESYENVPETEVQKFNKDILESGEFFTVPRMLEYYHIEPILNDHPQYATNLVALEGGKSQGSLIHQVSNNEALKIDLIAQPTPNGWKLLEIRKSYQCATGAPFTSKKCK